MATVQTRNAREAQGLSGYPRKRGTELLHEGEGPGPTETKPAIFDDGNLGRLPRRRQSKDERVTVGCAKHILMAGAAAI
ncbi:hypothetical protein RsS62_62750 [Rhizobium dioscoreae]|nr:hypothetical protein RsS62_62750 [Rhizobium dioscoreae]